MKSLLIPFLFIFHLGLAQDDGGISSIQNPTGDQCPGSIVPTVTLENFGSTALTTIDILYNVDGAANSTYVWTGNLTTGATIDINLPSISPAAGAHVFNATTSSPNGTTDSNTGNDASASNFTVTASILYTASITNTNCGTTDGSITINAVGGTGTLQYSIDGGVSFQASNTFSSLGLGAYNIVIEDANGCQKLGIENILTIGGPNIIIVTGQDPNCYGTNDGTIVISATGNGLTYSINGGTNFQTLAFFQNLSSGTYTVLVQDDTGCQTFQNVTLAEPTPISTIVFGNNAGCNSSNGSASVVATGGDGNFTYSWDDPMNQQSSNASGIPAGLYHVVVTDGNNCSVEDSVFIGNTGGPDVSLTSTDALCFNDSTGIITANAGGGSAPYSYLWNDPLNQTTATASNLPAGTYLVQVTDNNGCLVFENTTINHPSALTSSTSVIAASCGENNGVIIANISGGTSPYTFLWDDANSQTNSTAVNLAVGQYNIDVTDANGCTHSDMGEIISSGSFTITDSITNPSCEGIADGSIEIAISGGSSYTISWGTGETTELIENLIAGNYTVQVSDTTGCTISKSFTLTPESTSCMIIPTAISPNSDGKNDYWVIEGLDITLENQVEIYNRWGTLLYQSSAYQNDWDGTSSGKNLPTGGYFYIVTIGNKTYSGPLAIIR